MQRNSYPIEIRLQHWAAWSVSFKENKQGWPESSALYNFLREGFLGNENKAKTSSIPYHHPEAEEMNALYLQLKNDQLDKAEAIYVYYVSGLNIKKFSQDTKIAPSTFYRRLSGAKRWFEERLN